MPLPPSCHRLCRCKRSGFTLIEMLVAVMILVVGLAAAVRLMTGAHRQSQMATELAAIETICQSTMAELVASEQKITPCHPIPVQTVPGWQIAVRITPAMTPTGSDQLVAIHVVAQKPNDPAAVPFDLVRWVSKERVVSVPAAPSDPLAMPLSGMPPWEE